MAIGDSERGREARPGGGELQLPTRSRCCSATATGPSGRRRLRDRGDPELRGDRGPERGREARPGGGELAPRHRVRCCSATATAPSRRRPTYATGTVPSRVAIGDLNGDGKPDLAVANRRCSATVSVLLGNGNGDLRGEDDYGTGTPALLGGDRGPERGRKTRPGGGERRLQHGLGAARQRRWDLRHEERLRHRELAPLGGNRGPERGRETRPGGGERSSNTVSVLLNLSGLASAPALQSPADGSAISSSPQFVWQGIGIATAYSVVVATDPLLQSPIWTAQLTAGSTGVTYSGAPLSSGVGYYWSVRALVSGQWTAYAPPRHFSPSLGSVESRRPTLAAPTNLAIVALPETFSWSTVTGAATYRMMIGADPALSSPLWASGVSAAASAVVPAGIPGVVVGSTYYWTATAIDAAGIEGPASTARAFALSASSALPAQPVLVAPVGGSTVSTSVVAFAWNQAAGATRYRIVYSTSSSGFPAGSSATWALDGLAQTTAQVILPGGDATLYWKVIPANSSGLGAESAVESFHYSRSTGPLTGVVIENPAGNVKFGLNSSVDGDCEDHRRTQRLGAGHLEGGRRPTGSRSRFVPADAEHISTESPPLPTSVAGAHTIQCVVTSPSTVPSVAQPYEVVNRPRARPPRCPRWCCHRVCRLTVPARRPSPRASWMPVACWCPPTLAAL